MSFHSCPPPWDWVCWSCGSSRGLGSGFWVASVVKLGKFWGFSRLGIREQHMSVFPLVPPLVFRPGGSSSLLESGVLAPSGGILGIWHWSRVAGGVLEGVFCSAWPGLDHELGVSGLGPGLTVCSWAWSKVGGGVLVEMVFCSAWPGHETGVSVLGPGLVASFWA